jgi:hypothetical protein
MHPTTERVSGTGVVGRFAGAFSGSSRGLELAPAKRRCLVPPTSGYSSKIRWSGLQAVGWLIVKSQFLEQCRSEINMETTKNTGANDWWGHTQEHGWVVLDRNLGENQRGGSSHVLFVRCSDWTAYREKKENWDKPRYISENIFLTKLSFREAKKTIEELECLKNEYRDRRQGIHSQYSQSNQRDIKAIIEKHKVFLELLGMKPGMYKDAGQSDQNRRITHCYSCKTHLDNVHDIECSKCGWIVCENCGACGCGYDN